MAVLESKHYAAMVNPDSFVDVVPSGSRLIKITIIGAVRNAVVASGAGLPSGVLQRVKQKSSITHFREDDNIFNVRPLPELGITTVIWISTLSL